MQMKAFQAQAQFEEQRAQAARQEQMMQQQLELMRQFAEGSQRAPERRESGNKRARVRRDETGRMIEAILETVQ